jgi:hypothetical protein
MLYLPACAKTPAGRPDVIETMPYFLFPLFTRINTGLGKNQKFSHVAHDFTVCFIALISSLNSLFILHFSFSSYILQELFSPDLFGRKSFEKILNQYFNNAVIQQILHFVQDDTSPIN